MQRPLHLRVAALALTVANNPDAPRSFSGWRMIAIATLGVSTGTAPIVFASFGLFMKPLTLEFGWSRTEASAALTVLTASIALSLPFAGRIIDRFGVRALLLPSLVIVGLSLAAIPWRVSEIWHLAAVFLVIGTFGVGTNTVTYINVLTAWFDRHRGIAIGIGMSGMGLGFVFVPILTQYMIDHHGWRSGYYALSAIMLGITLPVVYLFLKNKPGDVGQAPDGLAPDKSEESVHSEFGIPLVAALRTTQFWLLATVFLLLSFGFYGLQTHLVPMLTDHGLPATTAALVASTIGGTVFVGRILIGYLIDRFFAPRVAVLFFSLSAIGFTAFALGASDATAFIAAALIGFSIGAELDFMAFLASRYFGLRAFGAISGLLLSCTLAGAALSPIAFAVWFDYYGAYSGILGLAAGANAIAVILLTLLGPYPEWNR